MARLDCNSEHHNVVDAVELDGPSLDQSPGLVRRREQRTVKRGLPATRFITMQHGYLSHTNACRRAHASAADSPSPLDHVAVKPDIHSMLTTFFADCNQAAASILDN